MFILENIITFFLSLNILGFFIISFIPINYDIKFYKYIDKLKNIKAPAGIDIGAVTPEEIALSIMSELIAKYKGGTYKPLMDIKGSYLLKKHKIPL